MNIRLFILLNLSILQFAVFAQSCTFRGFVYDKETGIPLVSAIVTFQSSNQGAYTNEQGLFAIAELKPGKYDSYATNVGYDTVFFSIDAKPDKVISHNFYITSKSKQLNQVYVSADKIRKTKEINISKTTIKPVQLTRIPSVGGEPDLVQYLQVLPGVVFSGDQGGQLYIRGGSPVMNKVLLDGLTVYNPFHSIGLFSVFDSDILKSVDVYSAGFSSEFGGRISAIVDVKTRDGNKNKFSGKVNSSPFNSKILLEGPLKKYKAGESSSSYIVSNKNSNINKSATIFYPNDNEAILT